jgi:hypothetical protein
MDRAVYSDVPLARSSVKIAWLKPKEMFTFSAISQMVKW